MSNTTTDSKSLPPHIALFPSVGMGHLMPILRIASMLLSRNCTVTLIIAKPTVSAIESSHISSFLSQYPQVKHVDFQTIQSHHSNPTTGDPLFLQFESISRSSHLLRSLLSTSSPALSAIFAQLALASIVTPIAVELGIPNYIVSTTSTKFLCLMAYHPVLVTDPAKTGKSSSELIIPGLTPFPISSIPPPFTNPNHPFTTRILVPNAQALSKANGIIVNSFGCFEPETLEAINNGRVLELCLPPILPIGPLESYEIKEKGQYMTWLDNQAEESVVYVNFGGRTAMSRGQIRELSKGLEGSGHKFLWVLMCSEVDKEYKDELKDLVGDSFLERTRDKGMAVKRWVSQQEILEHPSIGAFVNHCGWNSVMEAARRGIPMVAWPQHGDQIVSAEIVEKTGLGIWERKWEAELVCGEEIEKKIREVMEDKRLRKMAKKVGEEARKATDIDGSSDKVLKEVLEILQQ